MIREATDTDVPRLVEMGTRFLAETVYHGRFGANPIQWAQTVAQLLVRDDGAVFVSERDGLVVGMLGAVFFAHPVTGEPTVGELFWWVEPEYRGCGVRLLKRAEQWAREIGATKLHMVAPTPDVGALYERLGFRQLEVTYDKALGSLTE